VLLIKSAKQHIVEESNVSMLITNIGWIVEFCHRQIKCCNYLSNKSLILYMIYYLSFECAIINKYFNPLIPSNLDDELVTCRMLHLFTQHNKESVEQEALDKTPPRSLRIAI